MPRFFYQYFAHFLSFPEHFWKLIDDRPNVSVRLKIEVGVANSGGGKKKAGKHKEELVTPRLSVQHTRSEERQLLVGTERRPGKGTCGSWGWRLSHQTIGQASALSSVCFFSFFQTTTQDVSRRWTVDRSVATEWKCASRHAPHPESILVILVYMTCLPPLTTGDYMHHVTSAWETQGCHGC